MKEELPQIKNLYLESLRKKTDDELLKICEDHGRIMEKANPMSKEQKVRAFLAFKYAAGKPNISEDDKNALLMALRVLRIL